MFRTLFSLFLLAGPLLAQQIIPKPVSYQESPGREGPLWQAATKRVLDESIPAEGYEMDFDGKTITIRHSDSAGLFYAQRSLAQLRSHLPLDGTHGAFKIKDSPRFQWRGLMLDEARHFMGKAYVKRLLDTMAAHKMNRFHWHLTDDQGWRVEIKAYPKLTEIGAFRGKGTRQPTPEWDKVNKKDGDGPRYGGFYTQQDIKEIVAYAAKRHIEIIPEIDMPGHALAFAKAYPEVLPKAEGDAGKGVHGLSGNVISVAREENYRMLDTIFGELADLFPAKFIHVGGDEVNHKAWAVSPEHKALMKEKGFKSPGQLQNMFMLRLEKILKKHGKTLLGWNEIMHGGELSKDTGVIAWIGVGPGLQAARKGHPTIMAPGPHCYFDMKYPGPSERGHWWAGVVSTQRAYDWNPVFADQLNPQEQKRILGVQCALWTEFVPGPHTADYRLWPRACATAEVAWSPQERRDWKNFDQRLGKHLNFLDQLGVLYRVRPPQAVRVGDTVTIEPAHPGATTLFTLDGSEPDLQSPGYTVGTPLPEKYLKQLRYRTLRPNGRLSKAFSGIEDRTPYLNPKLAKIDTSLPNYAKHEAKLAADWDPQTFFWTNRPPKNGESFLITLADSLAVRTLKLDTGKPDQPGKDIAENAILELSSDGSTFQKAADFKKGSVKLSFDSPRNIKALRITFTGDQDSWLIVQDPKMR